MRLKSITIQNIRSIQKEQLDFPESTILFFGDVGSGKSSVLKAIEFALFGTMGDLLGESLLRRGEKKGWVELTFTIDEKTYTIYRQLEKEMKTDKETGEKVPKITQTEGWIVEDGVKTSYAPTELRIKMLSLLNYSLSRYKSTSKKCIDIYRYTVYTPQEEIKEILVADPEERFDILKDILEIEKYELTLSNLEKILIKLRSDIRDVKKDIEIIGIPEEEIPKNEQDIEDQNTKINVKNEEISVKQKEISKENKTKDNFQQEHTEYTKKTADIHSKQEIIRSHENSIKANEKLLEKLLPELLTKRKELRSLPQIELKTKKKEEELETEVKGFREKSAKISEDFGITQQKLDSFDTLLKEGKCSLCGQKIHDTERFNAELKASKDTLKKLKAELITVKDKISLNEELQKNLRDYEKNNQEKERLEELIKEKHQRQKDLVTTNENLKTEITSTQKEITDILTSYRITSLSEFEEQEKKIKKKLEKQKEEVDKLQDELIKLEKDLSSYETTLKNLEKQLEEQKKSLDRKLKLKNLHEFMITIEHWVADQLPVLIRDIERTILTTTASEFNQYFKEWFRALVEEENIDIQINPANFQPTVMINGHESPFRDMSGGERSALSLAYRLALNKVINVKHQDVKTKDLIILDEPTDGFSEQQVNKMQEVFDRLDTKQMIIISHERTLDSFVTDIYTFTKANHTTKISKESIKK